VASDTGALINLLLATGRPVWCYRYMVSYTYAGFMIHTPSESCNKHMLEIAQREAIRFFGDWPVYLIQPARQQDAIDYPRIQITGLFDSLPIQDEMHLSSLIVVWFQDQLFPVPTEGSLAAIQAVDWDGLALDYET
jgi:hypothetical protein